VYCFDTDILSAALRKAPSLPLLRRLALVPPSEQSTTAINVGELLYGASRKGDPALTARVRRVIEVATRVYAFDEAAAEVYGPLRARLEATGKPLDDPDLRIASIALARDLTLVTANLKHFSRIPDLRVENWLEEKSR
jgi:tRNA(fMet)-specific endonuclease VapC